MKPSPSSPPPRDLPPLPPTGGQQSTSSTGSLPPSTGTPVHTPPPSVQVGSGLEDAPQHHQTLSTPSQPPVFTRIRDMDLHSGNFHYGLGMDHLEQEIEDKTPRYKTLSTLMTQSDTHLKSIPLGRLDAEGLAALILDHEAGFIEAETPLTPENDPRFPGRLHSGMLGGSMPESRTGSTGGNYDVYVLEPRGLHEELGMHPDDHQARQCQALMLHSVLNKNTVLFHLDELNNLDQIKSGEITYDDAPSVTTSELLFIKHNWGRPLEGIPLLDMSKSSPKNIVAPPTDGRFDDTTVKFFLKGKEVPCPFQT